MKIRIRIYADREPDLYALYRACGPALTRKIFKGSFISYITGSAFDVNLPEINMDVDSFPEKNPMFDFTVPSELDGKLSKLPTRQTSTFAKTLVRYYTFWDLSKSFNVEHVIKPADKTPEQIKEPEKIKTNKSQTKTKADIPVKKEPVFTVVTEDIQQIENSDVNSLAALFSGIKIG